MLAGPMFRQRKLCSSWSPEACAKSELLETRLSTHIITIAPLGVSLLISSSPFLSGNIENIKIQGQFDINACIVSSKKYPRNQWIFRTQYFTKGTNMKRSGFVEEQAMAQPELRLRSWRYS
jgi:hypothetical protein